MPSKAPYTDISQMTFGVYKQVTNTNINGTSSIYKYRANTTNTVYMYNTLMDHSWIQD